MKTKIQELLHSKAGKYMFSTTPKKTIFIWNWQFIYGILHIWTMERVYKWNGCTQSHYESSPP